MKINREGLVRGYLLRFACTVLLLIAGAAFAGEHLEQLEVADARAIFPTADRLGGTLAAVSARPVFAGDKVLGWIFLNDELHPIPAYSGKPVSALVGIDAAARIVGARIVAHEEPILVIGVSDGDLQRFIAQYAGIKASDQVRVGAGARAGYRGIDAISGATITVMVINQSIMRAAEDVASALGLPLASGAPLPGADLDSAPVKIAPARIVTPDQDPYWLQLWEEREGRLFILGAALLLLVTMLVFQDWLVVRPRLFTRLRNGYMLFTVFFIGFYSMGQLSIVNMLAFGRVMSGGFSWETLLIEPVAFMLWSFVAVTIILWGRGVYCGWLCPFGALQELIHTIARHFGVPQHEFPAMVHERLWAIKYLILIGLFGLSLDSMAHAATMAEVEPFKTVFALHFVRDWSFVVYALALLAISAVNSKFYCKYLCPLGAALSFFTRFRIFDWLRRRSECGNPCQTCAAHCQIGAIRPTGEIIENECHYCLECQVVYHDEHRCPPLVEKRKRREKREARAAQITAVQVE
ncbi:MAG: 4Fe-4S binding protein [Pseudomonadales bacterium]|nr:4Fe-4S binding protein [Pseudomonadales bacterium]